MCCSSETSGSLPNSQPPMPGTEAELVRVEHEWRYTPNDRQYASLLRRAHANSTTAGLVMALGYRPLLPVGLPVDHSNRAFLDDHFPTGNRYSGDRDGGAKIPLCPELVSAETGTRAINAANSGPFGSCRELSAIGRLRGGPGRCAQMQ